MYPAFGLCEGKETVMSNETQETQLEIRIFRFIYEKKSEILLFHIRPFFFDLLLKLICGRFWRKSPLFLLCTAQGFLLLFLFVTHMMLKIVYTEKRVCMKRVVKPVFHPSSPQG